MRFKKWLIPLAAALTMIGAGSWWLASADQPPPADSVPSIANASTIFQEVLPKIRESQIPPRLPTYIPSHGQQQSPNSEPLPVYANLSGMQSDGYSIILGYSRDCDGGNACRLGTVSGEVKPTRSISADYNNTDYLNSKDHRSSEPAGAISLTNNIQGQFLPWRCATNCSDAQVVWDEGNYRYTVGIKMGDRASLVRMANSAIENRE